jgi:hypothetical protein
MGATVVDPAMAIDAPLGPHSEAEAPDTNSAKSAAVVEAIISSDKRQASGATKRLFAHPR